MSVDTVVPIVFYDNFRSNEPHPESPKWEDLKTLLTEFSDPICDIKTCQGRRLCEAKTHRRSWSPVRIEGKRSNENVRAITCAVFDLDRLKPGDLDKVLVSLSGYDAVIHSTHSHEPESESYRLVMPVSREMTPAEWPKVCDAVVRVLEIPTDPCVLKISQLYALPTCRAGVEEVTRVLSGEPLNVDEALALSFSSMPAAAHPPTPAPPAAVNLEDLRARLSRVRASKARGRAKEKEQADLLGKVLNGESPAEPGARGSTLLRISGLLGHHLPADTEWEVALEILRPCLLAMDTLTPPSGLDHWIAVVKDQYLRAQKGRKNFEEKKRLEEARFEDIRRRIEANPEEKLEDVDWKETLIETRDGGCKGNEFNAYTLIKNAPEFANFLRWNEVTKKIEVSEGPFSHLNENILEHKVSSHLQRYYNFQGGIHLVGPAILCVARENSFDPIVEYLREIAWDGVERLDTFFENYFGAILIDEDGDDISNYVRTVSRKWLIALVARALEPGCKFDNVLVLEGLQGVGKSTALEALVGSDYFLDTALTIGEKDTMQAIASSWLVELGELASFKRAETEKIKQFFSSHTDRFRPPYGRVQETSPRRCVFVGTTNDSIYLEDRTGNRRYLPIRVTKTLVDLIKRDRDLILAEAVLAYVAGERWYLDADMALLAEEQTSKRVPQSAIAGAISRWWHAMRPERRPRTFDMTDVTADVLNLPIDRVSRSVQIEVGRALVKLGFVRRRRLLGGKQIKTYEPSKELLEAVIEAPPLRTSFIAREDAKA